jgi:LuxR family transcriptional regulator
MADLLSTFTAELSAASCLDAAMDILADTVGSLGFPRVAYAYLPVPRLSDGTWLPPPVLTRNYPARWNTHWDRYSAHDPYYHACFESTLSLDWQTIQMRPTLTPVERDSWHYLADRSLCQGITMPLHLPGGRFAYLSAVGDMDDETWAAVAARSRTSLFLVAHQFQACVAPWLGRAQHGGAPHLTARELECLSWAAQGKTAADIACVLDRSVETVRLHLKRSIRKLGALNRPHAVAKAVSYGLLDPSSIQGAEARRHRDTG